MLAARKASSSVWSARTGITRPEVFQFGLEGVLLAWIQLAQGRLEMLDLQAVFGPMRTGLRQPLQHAFGAAGIDLRVGLRLRQQGGEIVALALRADIEPEALAVQGGEFVQQRHAGARASAVVQGVVDAQFTGAARHGADRRDADAAGDEDQAAGRFIQAEVVARAAYAQAHARFHMLVHPGRTAAALGFAQHGHPQAARVGGISAK